MSIPDRKLLQWLAEPPAERGVHFAGPDDSWTRHSYGELARLTLRAAAALRASGVRRDDVVVIVQRSSPGFVASFFGAIAAGATPCSVPPPFAFQRTGEYEKHTRHLFDTARPAMVVCDEESLVQVASITDDLALPTPVPFETLIAGVDPAEKPYPPAEFALLQFTSGSSGASRGVLVSHSALQANVTAMRKWLRWEPEYRGMSWLPVHHDMGLIGCMINMVVTSCDTWMMQPEDFIRSPLMFLKCMSDNKVGLTASPNFALAHIVRRVEPAQLEGLRFDSMRSLILGAERIDPEVLTAFHDLVGPHGFDRRALLPAYGAAEGTLAITGLPVGEGWTAVVPEDSVIGAENSQIVGCGRPLEGVTVTVVDEDGQPVPDGIVGEIVMTGTSVATRYVGNPGSASRTALDGGVLRTGDAAFLRDGQLFVLGRLGDGLKVHGRMVFAEMLEMQLRTLGIPDRRGFVLLGQRDGRPTGVAVLEKPRPDWESVAHGVLSKALVDADLFVLEVARGQVPVTSSGKPRRRLLWTAIWEGRTDGEIRPLSAAVGS